MRRRLIWVVIVLVILVVGADRVAWKVAEGELASRIQTTEGLASKPDVSIGGFPFLTQVFGGRYQDVKANISGLSIDRGTSIDEVKVQLNGLQVPFSQLVNRDLSSVPVDSGTVTGVVSYDSLDAALNRSLKDNGLEVHLGQGRSGGNQLALSGSVKLGSVSQQISGDVVIDIADEKFSISVPQGSLGLPLALRNQLVPLLQVSQRLPTLPLGLKISRFTSAPDGIAVTATGSNLTLGTGDLG